jgi:hypothetical protein
VIGEKVENALYLTAKPVTNPEETSREMRQFQGNCVRQKEQGEARPSVQKAFYVSFKTEHVKSFAMGTLSEPREPQKKLKQRLVSAFISEILRGAAFRTR